ncbi:radical SAM protein [Methanoplanus sp. FWC-SCC4]|uniref:Radical SAM protein n=2 Tax=Methanochimaera problematica TaxID=2609417 RepID=A0AA97I2D1_9EURY|nr:radical SAM protein [Methanoplanus sp. FWC-SCC4]
MDYKYLFGPVPSRRLGISLGIDLVTPKICSYNCIYCECGKTTCLTVNRKEFVPAEIVIKELDDFLSKNPKIDYITFAGSGEPTLNSGIGKIAVFLKEKYPQYKTALLTNGSLLGDNDVLNDCKDIDLVVPSLDAALEKSFFKIDRPHHSLKIDAIIDGIAKFRTNFSGKMWLEIFLVPGINDKEEEIEALNRAILKINPDKVQVNILDRPGTVDWIRRPDDDELKNFASKILHSNVEITGKPADRDTIASFSGDIKQKILETIKRRPCTPDDLSKILGLHQNEINKYLGYLVENNEIVESAEERGIFYKVKQKN